jgi:hypothetical protein
MRTGRAAVLRYPRLPERCRRCRSNVDAEHDNNEAKIERYQPRRSALRSKNDRWDDHEPSIAGVPLTRERIGSGGRRSGGSSWFAPGVPARVEAARANDPDGLCWSAVRRRGGIR